MRISDWSSDVCSSDLEFLDPLASGERVATLVHGGSAFVPCARAADLFLIVDRDAGVRLVPASEGVTIEAVRASDRSEARRVGKACVSTCRSRWSPYH